MFEDEVSPVPSIRESHPHAKVPAISHLNHKKRGSEIQNIPLGKKMAHDYNKGARKENCKASSWLLSGLEGFHLKSRGFLSCSSGKDVKVNEVNHHPVKGRAKPWALLFRG